MLVLGPVGFAVPALLWALAVLPVLWFLLRAVPPAPLRRRFPGVALLLGLSDRETEAERTPIWLMALRILALALVIIGFAGPVLNPSARPVSGGPLLILVDGSWAQAPGWPRLIDEVEAVVAEAARAGRPVQLASLADPEVEAGAFAGAEQLVERLPGLKPLAWEPSDAALSQLAAILPAGRFDTVWFSDGLGRPGRAALAEALAAHGSVTARESGRAVLALGPPVIVERQVRAEVLRSRPEGRQVAEVTAIGVDPAGIERELARVNAGFDDGATVAVAVFDLPPELRNRITRFELAGQSSAGAVTLTDDALKRRKVGLADTVAGREGLELLSPTHYLRRALAPSADLVDGTLGDLLLAVPDILILPDIAHIPEAEAVLAWVEAGGLLVRFAGPNLAASDSGRDADDPLLPVRLRAGGREVGGTMSWGEPRTLAPFADGTPFHGLAIPADVTVGAQVLAQPGPDLAERAIATLSDGTPLVTRKAVGAGQVVLFHVTANADWSSLPLSGLFVQMLERLAVASGTSRHEPADLAGTIWQAERVLDGYGILTEAADLPGVPGEVLAKAPVSPEVQPGIYASGDRRLAVNVMAPGRTLVAATWPAAVRVEGPAAARETNLKGWALAVAFGLLLVDSLAALAVSGRLRRSGIAASVAAATIVSMSLVIAAPRTAQSQTSEAPPDVAARTIAAAENVALAYIRTGDARIDQISHAGLLGLSRVLYARTAVEPGDPLPIDPATDELSVLTFLYWPVTPDQPLPSPEAYARLNRYLRSGGMILFDTRDGDIAGYGAATPAGKRLQMLAAPLEIPPLEPLPPDHVLTRSFYLVQDFPGRYASRAVWVEAAPPDAELAEGMPFRNLNDGVTPVVIGGNDWAAAWAVDDAGLPMLPVGRGMAGERQREIAYRFGVNLIMHVLTGNYKSDQVHVPALLERLGQ